MIPFDKKNSKKIGLGRSQTMNSLNSQNHFQTGLSDKSNHFSGLIRMGFL
ncbi:hypothetical protein P872_17770 [Rhodonellum psychrophilum GCM71 = DSM 17998]|uniref:Uncharacterized protein n=1 Tax=Rhodonellum psychrophilum GCM71 = DSM 17998 TaxID=1123057 RepID=U5BY34_9BACT|nr:hypothetical protein P872_17770 [Rhodonellum psychrophilum GCM71 = DSM 17998]